MIGTAQQLPIRSPIFGPAYSSRSGNLADQRCVNLYPEVVETKTGKEIGALYGTPGLVLKATVGNGPIRSLHAAALGPDITGTSAIPKQLLYVVSGTDLYSVDANFNSTLIAGGGIGGPGGYIYSLNSNRSGFDVIILPFNPQNSDSFVTMADNGEDLCIFVGVSVMQIDGFMFVNQPGSYNFYQSDLLDGSSWPALQFANASVEPDPIVVLTATRNELFVMKQKATEVWNNNGTPNFAFGREQGVYIEAGCAAPMSVAKSGEVFFMLARNRQGQGVVVKLNGYRFDRVSTHFIERQIQAWPNMADAIGYAYQQEGHQFYVLSSPSGDQTWVYDDTVSGLTGIPMWHERASYSSIDGMPHRHWGNCTTTFAGFNLIGDYRNGNIYSYDLATFTDNGNPRVWLRSWRALPQRTGRMVKFNSLTIDMETGGATEPPTQVPNVMLRWSDDGGYTWGPQMITSAGTVGQTSRRVKFNRLGALRFAKGYDRIFELSSADQFPVALVGALVE